MTAPLAPGSPRLAAAKRFGDLLQESMTRRGGLTYEVDHELLLPPTQVVPTGPFR